MTRAIAAKEATYAKGSLARSEGRPQTFADVTIIATNLFRRGPVYCSGKNRI